MSSEKISRIIDRLNDPDLCMRAIRTLERLGAEAKDAVPALWNVAKEWPKEMRAPALKAIVAIDGGASETVRRLLDRLNNDPAREVRLQAAQSLGECGRALKGAIPDLEDRLNIEEEREVRQGIVRTMIQVAGEKDRLFALAKEALQSAEPNPALIRAAHSILEELELSDTQTTEVLDAMWKVVQQDHRPLLVWDVFDAYLDMRADDDAVLEKLLSDGQITPANKSMVIGNKKFSNSVIDYFAKSKDIILPILWETLTMGYEVPTPGVIYILGGILKDKTSPNYDAVLEGVEEFFNKNERFFKTVQSWHLIHEHKPDVVKNGINISQQDRDVKSTIGQFLLTGDGAFLDERWSDDSNNEDDSNKERVLQYVLEALKVKNVQFNGLSWLKDRIVDDFPPRLIEQVKKALDELLQEIKVDNSVEIWMTSYVEEILDQFTKQSEKLEDNRLLEDIRKTGEGTELIGKIEGLVRKGSENALRGLVELWVKWIILDNQPSVVDATAARIRNSHFAVLPLIEQLAKDIPLELDEALRTMVYKEIEGKSPQIRNLIERIKSDGEAIKPADESSLREWIKTYENQSDKFAALFQKAKDQAWLPKKQANEIIQLLYREKQLERKLAMNRKVAQQLASMSDDRRTEKVEKELKDHAIPALIRLLPEETDTNVRENLARTLGNLGGREAVNALVRAIVAEEKKRESRQLLLAKYYLEPSKMQSEEMSQILSEVAKDSKKTLILLQGLNITVFAVGITLLVAGTLTSLFREDTASRLVGGLAGIGGLAGVITLLVKDPLDRIQNAMANLVQIETAFTSYIWELNLNGTYIQSQYVAQGVLTNEEIVQTVGRIENAMSLAMNQVAVYTEAGRQRVVTRINSLSPAAGDATSQISVHGQHLQGDDSQRKVQAGMIAINHIPIQPDSITWNEEVVKFKLPLKIPSLPGLESDNSTIWVSLLIDGMETNALPFHVLNSGT